MKIQHDRRATLIACALLWSLLSSCSNQDQTAPTLQRLSGGGASLQQSVAATPDEVPFLPNSALTPGETYKATKEDVCTPGYAKTIRDVTEEEKKQVYDEYNIPGHQPGEYEVDHLISLELGGSNDIKNLWPQSYRTRPWNAHVKDKLENELHREVCDGQIDLKAAQQEIAGNWIETYKQVFHTDIPKSNQRRSSSGSSDVEEQTGARSSDESGGSASKVWVNTRSGKYFLPGTEYYGKTREGEYMSEANALRQGYRAAQSRQ